MHDIDDLRNKILPPSIPEHQAHQNLERRSRERAERGTTGYSVLYAPYPALFKYFISRVPQLIGQTADVEYGVPIVLTSWKSHPASVEELATLASEEAGITLSGRRDGAKPGPVLTITLFNLGAGGTGLIFSPEQPFIPPPGPSASPDAIARHREFSKWIMGPTLETAAGISLHKLFSQELSDLLRHWKELDEAAQRHADLENLARELDEIRGRAPVPEERMRQHSIFGASAATLDPGLCFTLMPFAAPFDEIWQDCISLAIRDVGLSPLRADDIYGPRVIVGDIWQQVLQSRVLVSDLTGKNPNVFYELGLAHALDKDVVLISQSLDDVPFDLRALRIIIYSTTGRGLAQLREKLVASLQTILRTAIPS
jgi:hypothetical protein